MGEILLNLASAPRRQYIYFVHNRTSLCNFGRYYETVSDVLSSVKKMEESLKRLKQARKTASSISTSTNGGPTDDAKIRIQLALDVEYLGDQVRTSVQLVFVRS